jgi:hypothetical protein
MYLVASIMANLMFSMDASIELASLLSYIQEEFDRFESYGELAERSRQKAAGLIPNYGINYCDLI